MTDLLHELPIFLAESKKRVQRNGLGVKAPASLPVQPGVSDPFGSNARGT